MTTFQLIFYAITLLALAGAVGLTLTRNVIHGALFLVLALLAVAGLYLVLLADFLALVQVLLYGGAVTILILFAMMLTQVREQPETLDNPQKPWAEVVAALTFLSLSFVAFSTPWRGGDAATLTHVNFQRISTALFSQWAVPFEIASLVLLVALVGAVIIARQERE